MDIKTIQARFRAFAKEREWEQFHSPKNIAMALTVEAGELLEQFQWMSEEASFDLDLEKKERVAQEIADVQLYLCRIADLLNIDIAEAVDRKMVINEAKYPAEQVRGSAKKYTEY